MECEISWQIGDGTDCWKPCEKRGGSCPNECGKNGYCCNGNPRLSHLNGDCGEASIALLTEFYQNTRKSWHVCVQGKANRQVGKFFSL
jgi:hypothetical protein